MDVADWFEIETADRATDAAVGENARAPLLSRCCQALGPPSTDRPAPSLQVAGRRQKIDQRVDRAAAAKCSSARPCQLPAAERGLGFGSKAPVQPRPLGSRIPGWYDSSRIPRSATRFNQTDRARVAVGQAAGQPAARCAATDDQPSHAPNRSAQVTRPLVTIMKTSSSVGSLSLKLRIGMP
jgi:hypothetical protein